MHLSLVKKKKKSKKQNGPKKTIKANIVKDYLYIDDILDNLVKTRNGKSSATLRFSTEDVETLNEADIDILERNIFGLGKKFRVETKIRVMEDRQDLMGLVDKMERGKNTKMLA